MSRRQQSLKAWLLAWVEAEYPQAEFSRPDARERSFNAVPRGYLPSMDKLLRDWWVKSFNTYLARAGFGFPEAEAGVLVVRQLELPWDEERALLVGKLRLVREDRDAVQDDLEAWAAINAPGMDIEATMHELLAAAGL